MKKIRTHSISLSTIIFVCALLFDRVNGLANEDTNLDNRLRAIRYAQGKDETEQTALETECLDLIATYTSPSEKGKIYSTLAFIYSDRGYGPHDDPNLAGKALKYSIKALEYPLDPLTACYMYTRGSDALIVQSRHEPNKPLLDIREEAVDLCLKGLKLALENEAPKEYPTLPDWAARISVSQGTPFSRVVRLHNNQINAREKWLFKTEFCGLRQGLFSRCVSLYSRKSYDRETFQKKVREILIKHEETINELITALDTQITNKGSKITKNDKSE